MVFLLYFVDFGLRTGTDLLMYYVFFEVLLADDLLVQRSHPLLKDLGDLTLQGRWGFADLRFWYIDRKSVPNVA